MHRQILYDIVNSQVFNDQFEVPGLAFLPDFTPNQVNEITDIAFDLLATSLANDNTNVNAIIGTIAEMTIRFCNKERNKAKAAAKLGCFMMSCFTLAGIIDIKVEDGVGEFIDYDANRIKQMWDEREKPSAIKPTLYPSSVSVSRLIKHGTNLLNTSETPIPLNTVEKMFNRGWLINTNILVIALDHFKRDAEVFKSYYKSTNPVARESKKALCKAILDLAIELQSKRFYHKYFFDFRGRIYPATGFLHEQGNDLAKSLVMLADGKPLGEHGEKWIKHAIASTWAGMTRFGLKSDKLSLEQRVQWVDENTGVFLNYANNPQEFPGWIKADAPWQFLSACIELALIQQWKAAGRDPQYYISHFICYIDGSCNGSQHLAALTRDEEAAIHVNLRANMPVGDLYKYISEFVWNKIAKMPRDEERLLPVVEQVIAIRKKLLQADKEAIPAIYEELSNFKAVYKELIKEAAPIYWEKITDPNERRKIVKRNVMTLVYGVTRYGAGEQVVEDAPKHGIEYLEGMDRAWGNWLGSFVYDTMMEAMPTSANLLRVFETAGKRKGTVNKPLEWRTPLVNFPVIQDYRMGIPTKYKGEYFGEPLHITVRDPENTKESPSKQKTGAPPNIVHSMDATHLMLTAEYCKEPLVTVHDSFGTLAGGMEQLHEDVRNTFIMLYYNNPLDDLLKQLGIDDLEVKRGSFNILEVAKADYCFL